jgi:predicted RNA-binding protein with PIN domain
LRFSRLPDRALATVRRVLEQDEAFRSRVADAASEEVVGRAAWLWLTRPAGWEEELAGLVSEASELASSARDEQEERSARRRLSAAEEARRRADAAAATATAAAAKASEELAAERQARRAAEVKIEPLVAERAGLEARLAQLLARAETAEQLSQRLRHSEIGLVEERDRLVERVASLEADLTEERRNLAAVSTAEGLTREAVAGAVGDAARAAQQLGAALAAASRALGGGTDVEPRPPPPAVSGPLSDTRGGGASGTTRNDRAPKPRRRQPVALPPAVFEDSAEAAEYLVRVPQTMLLVDGYNVSLQAWPDVPIPEQRRRLIDALSGLAARTGVAVHVVFDGAEQPEVRPPPLPPRSPVRLQFSPPDVEADEVLIELAELLPTGRPVTVATSDRRVQDEVRKRGANVITTPQLLGLLGRAPMDTRRHTPSS